MDISNLDIINFNKISPKIENYFNIDLKVKTSLKYLKDRDVFFWDCINSLYLISDLASDSTKDSLQSPITILRNKYINCVVSSYNLLCANMQSEFVLYIDKVMRLYGY
ncbi:hypothetical protein K9O30_06210 [Clostridium bowmanii]|uniref:hypothetical protein n=1 Tax=Clostridium bowmanii TaxID=132925 RepID=UPI001C0B3113|nr:hypothetical protein [Clostridium bowmanii]MBU3188753.1 hypothetical protein [Clostridium bowmanii]MCA1073338.1 hypothetical protein [Clostridium bowmanii]